MLITSAIFIASSKSIFPRKEPSRLLLFGAASVRYFHFASLSSLRTLRWGPLLSAPYRAKRPLMDRLAIRLDLLNLTAVIFFYFSPQRHKTWKTRRTRMRSLNAWCAAANTCVRLSALIRRFVRSCRWMNSCGQQCGCYCVQIRLSSIPTSSTSRGSERRPRC